MAPRITLEDLERQFGSRKVKQLFTDDGSNTPNTDRLNDALEAGSREGDAVLRNVWTTDEQLDAMVQDDAAVRRCYCAFAMAIGAEAHPEWFRDGEGPYAKIAARAKATLKDIVKAELRPKGEETAGANPLNQLRVVAPDPHFEFAPVGGKRQSGGF